MARTKQPAKEFGIYKVRLRPEVNSSEFEKFMEDEVLIIICSKSSPCILWTLVRIVFALTDVSSFYFLPPIQESMRRSSRLLPKLFWPKPLG